MRVGTRGGGLDVPPIQLTQLHEPELNIARLVREETRAYAIDSRLDALDIRVFERRDLLRRHLDSSLLSLASIRPQFLACVQKPNFSQVADGKYSTSSPSVVKPWLSPPLKSFQHVQQCPGPSLLIAHERVAHRASVSRPKPRFPASYGLAQGTPGRLVSPRERPLLGLAKASGGLGGRRVAGRSLGYAVCKD